jgi:hypothetical protein
MTLDRERLVQHLSELTGRTREVSRTIGAIGAIGEGICHVPGDQARRGSFPRFL